MSDALLIDAIMYDTAHTPRIDVRTFRERVRPPNLGAIFAELDVQCFLTGKRGAVIEDRLLCRPFKTTAKTQASTASTHDRVVLREHRASRDRSSIECCPRVEREGSPS
jgi:hypothetical protein